MPPKLIFIVPYRDRPQDKHFYITYMKHIMEDHSPSDYEIYFSEQNYQHKDFNRGAVKNIGFLAIKEKYPDDYADMTFVFNDVDTIPYKKGLLNFETNHGVIKHFFGFTFALGGIFSITGADFERIKGFPNYWKWGHEDSVINLRAKLHKIKIDRSKFFKIHDKNIVQLNNEFERHMDISTSNIGTDYVNTFDIIMNVKTKIVDDTIFIEHFDLALDKKVFDHTIDLKQNKKEFSRDLRMQKNIYRRKYGFPNNYSINMSIPEVEEYIKEKNIDINNPLINYSKEISNYRKDISVNPTVNKPINYLKTTTTTADSQITLETLTNKINHDKNAVQQIRPVDHFKIFSYVL